MKRIRRRRDTFLRSKSSAIARDRVAKLKKLLLDARRVDQTWSFIHPGSRGERVLSLSDEGIVER